MATVRQKGCVCVFVWENKPRGPMSQRPLLGETIHECTEVNIEVNSKYYLLLRYYKWSERTGISVMKTTCIRIIESQIISDSRSEWTHDDDDEDRPADWPHRHYSLAVNGIHVYRGFSPKPLSACTVHGELRVLRIFFFLSPIYSAV